MVGGTLGLAVGMVFALLVVNTGSVYAAPIGRLPSPFRSPATSPEAVLYGFVDGGAYGSFPEGGVVADKKGNLFGTTTQGGFYGGGTLFELSRSASGYTFSDLHDFQGGADGYRPYGSVIVEPNGALFGTTLNGGNDNLGTVYKFTPAVSGYTESILYSFTGGATDGQNPFSGVISDKHGALYGTTGFGGSFGGCTANLDCGTVFKLTPKGKAYTESILHYFIGGGDGSDPYGSLVMDSSGVLYGTTEGGGAYGFGTVFSVLSASRNPVYGILYSFTGAADGAYPYAALTIGPGGTLFGTNMQSTLGTPGTIFRLTPTGPGGYALTTIFTFTGTHTGGDPQTNLILNANGQIYGTAYFGGATSNCSFGCGLVFRLVPAAGGYTEKVIYKFNGGNSDAANPTGNIFAVGGTLYGATVSGWTNGEGAVYKLKI